MLQASSNMSKDIRLWLNAESNMSELYSKYYGLFNHDEWINIEYQGLNSYFVNLTYRELIDQFNEGIQMGHLTTAMVLSKLKETFDKAD